MKHLGIEFVEVTPDRVVARLKVDEHLMTVGGSIHGMVETYCRARLTDITGAKLGEAVAGPANIRFGLERSFKAILQATTECLVQAGLSIQDSSRVTACLALASCGGSDAKLLPGNTAQEIGENVDAVQLLVAEEECVDAKDAALEVSSEVEALREIDPKLKEALEKAAARLNEVVGECEEETKDTTELETVPETTESEEEPTDASSSQRFLILAEPKIHATTSGSTRLRCWVRRT